VLKVFGLAKLGNIVWGKLHLIFELPVGFCILSPFAAILLDQVKLFQSQEVFDHFYLLLIPYLASNDQEPNIPPGVGGKVALRKRRREYVNVEDIPVFFIKPPIGPSLRGRVEFF
jgi:hypothetical protein